MAMRPPPPPPSEFGLPPMWPSALTVPLPSKPAHSSHRLPPLPPPSPPSSPGPPLALTTPSTCSTPPTVNRIAPPPLLPVAWLLPPPLPSDVGCVIEPYVTSEPGHPLTAIPPSPPYAPPPL